MPDRMRQTVSEWAPTEGLDAAPQAAVATLEYALQRYLAMNCVTKGVIPAGVAIRDRTEHLDLFTPGDDGYALLDDRNQVEFMHRVSRLPRAWCAWWTYRDFLRQVAEGAVEGCPVAAVDEAYESALDITEEAYAC
jgi:hypothetical protein